MTIKQHVGENFKVWIEEKPECFIVHFIKNGQKSGKIFDKKWRAMARYQDIIDINAGLMNSK